MKNKRKVAAYLIEFTEEELITRFGKCAWVYKKKPGCWRVRNDETGDVLYFDDTPLRCGIGKQAGVSYEIDF